MVTEDHVSFKIAKLLKEKGFDETCRAFWKKWNGEINLCDCNSSHTFEYCHNTMLEKYNDNEELNIAAPTLQMAMKWLRDIHGLFIHIDVIREASCWLADIQDIKEDVSVYSVENEFPNYEKACETAIKYCLENLI